MKDTLTQILEGNFNLTKGMSEEQLTSYIEIWDPERIRILSDDQVANLAKWFHELPDRAAVGLWEKMTQGMLNSDEEYTYTTETVRETAFARFHNSPGIKERLTPLLIQKRSQRAQEGIDLELVEQFEEAVAVLSDITVQILEKHVDTQLSATISEAANGRYRELDLMWRRGGVVLNVVRGISLQD